MIKRTVIVKSYVEVEIDEAKFDEEFMNGFNESIFEADIDEHFKHLAQLFARHVIYSDDQFVEGYGHIDKMGIKLNVLDVDTETVDD